MFARGSAAVALLVLLSFLACQGCGPEGAGKSSCRWAAGRTLRVGGYTPASVKTTHLFIGSLVEALTGCRVTYTEGNSRSHLEAMKKAAAGSPPFDVVYLTGIVQNQALTEGLLDKIDRTEIRFLDDLEPNARVHAEYGPGVQFYTVGLCYNRDAVAEAGVPPLTRWSDLWRYKRLRGRVAIPDLVHTAGVDFLMAATRVAGADPKTLEGLKKGIAKIGELEPALVYGPMMSLHEAINAGRVWVAPAYNDTAFEYRESLTIEFVLPEDKGFGHVTALCIPKGAPNRDLALAYLAIALSPAAQISGAVAKSGGPTNQKIYGILGAHPSLTRRFPLGTDDFDRLVVPDWGPINAVRSEIEKLWSATFKAQ